MGSKLSGLGHALYDSKRREFLGRDGARWGKLGVFYFFFYLGLAGFFCTMLAVFMAFTPRDVPRYDQDASRMRTRSNPLSPGLGFRPQPDVDKNLIVVDRNAPRDANNSYVDNLNKYLEVYYWKQNDGVTRDNDRNSYANGELKRSSYDKFTIPNAYGCTKEAKYGFPRGEPCVLVKMNKIVGFLPEQGFQTEEESIYNKACANRGVNGIAVHCFGEYPADIDNIGPITYISESGRNNYCGSLNPSRFPYEGKYERKDRYQAPYIWVQFNRPAPNVLINVICRVFGKNIDFDKKTGRALTRFQIYVQDKSQRAQKRVVGEF